MQINWFWITVGFIPYSIKCKQTKDERIFTVQAIFWRVTICKSQKKCSWDIAIPLIEYMKR